jgi:hypothetical protein
MPQISKVRELDMYFPDKLPLTPGWDGAGACGKGGYFSGLNERLTTIDYISEDFVDAALDRTDGEGGRETGPNGGETFWQVICRDPTLRQHIYAALGDTGAGAY